MEIIDRNQAYLKEKSDAAIEKIERERAADNEVTRLYTAFISLAKDSIKVLQESLIQDVKMRGAIGPIGKDLETGELIWNTMEFTHANIREEIENIKYYKEVINESNKKRMGKRLSDYLLA